MASDSHKSTYHVLMVNRGVFRVPPESSGGGAEKHGYYLANNLALLGHPVDFVSKIRHGSLFHSRVKVHPLPPRRSIIPPKTSFTGWTFKHLFANTLSILTTLRLLQREKFRFDVIHCHSALTALVVSAIVGKRIPVVYTMHDSPPWIASYRNMLERWMRKAVFIGVEVPCLRRVTRVVAVSPALATEATRWKADGRRVVYIPSGIDSDYTQNSHPEDGKGPVGLFVGQLVPRKGMDILVEAIAKLRNNKARFLIVGDGPEREKLLKQSASEGVSDRVHFAGYVREKELVDYYGRASFFVFPSLAESFGFALFEAMSHGLPTIASNLKAYDGVLSTRDNTLLFEPGNPRDLALRLDELLQDPELGKTLAKNGLVLVRKRFNWMEIADRVSNMYSDLIQMEYPKPRATRPDAHNDAQGAISQIATAIASAVPAESIYLVGSRAQHPSYGNDYDVVVVIKSWLVPFYVRRLKQVGSDLSSKLGCKVDVSPLTSFRLRRAKGNLFLMKSRSNARLLRGRPVLNGITVGDKSDLSIDWYFSYYSFLLKELLAASNPDRLQTEPISEKIAEGLEYLASILPAGIAKMVLDHTRTLRDPVISANWLTLRDVMLALFAQLSSAILLSNSGDIVAQADALLNRPKGKNISKNFEYAAVLLLRGDVARPDRVFSRKLIIDRYRVALILLLAAVSGNSVNGDLTVRAYRILEGCMSLKQRRDPEGCWKELRSALLRNWDISQSLMGF